MADPVARSPIRPASPVTVIDGWEVSTRVSSAPLTLADETSLTKIVVHAPEHGAYANERSAVPFGRAIRHPDGTFEIGAGPGEWFFLGVASERRAELAARGADGADDFVTVVDLTHGRALVRLSGADAPRVMAKVCAIDLDDAVTPDGSAFRTSVAKLVTDVVRDDLAEGTRSYLLHCDRSSGQYLFDALLDAGAEFGIEVVGSTTIHHPDLDETS